MCAASVAKVLRWRLNIVRAAERKMRSVTMFKPTEQDIQAAVENCYWRKEVHGVAICTGMCAPCVVVMESGDCDTMKDLFAGEIKEE